MNENLPVGVEDEPRLRRKSRKKIKKAALVAFLSLSVMIGAMAFLLSKGLLPNPFSKSSDAPAATEETPPESTPQNKTDIYSYDKSTVPDGYAAIVPVDITAGANTAEELKPVFGSGAVVVVAAHPFEAYLVKESPFIDDGYEPTGGEFTTARLARFLAEKLMSHGVNAIYLDVGTSSARGSYSAAAKIIGEYMSQNDVCCIIDVHRAALIGEGGEIMRPITQNENGETVAQTSLVSARGGDKFDTRSKNSACLCSAMNALCPRSASAEFCDGVINQNIDAVFFTAEIGSYGNSFDEASRGAEIMALALADLIK